MLADTPALTSLALILAGLGAGVLLLNALIRRGLAAPRIIGEATPGDLPWQAVRIPTVRGKTLFAWFIPSAPGAPCLAVLHGWGSNAEMMLPLARPLHAAGISLLFLEARNHGRSDGDTFSSMPRFAEDLSNAIDWLRQQPGIDGERLAVAGHSVGAAAALLTASRRNDLRAVVSLSAFAHPADMMRRWLASKHIPAWPLGVYILAYVQHVIGHRFDAIAPCNTIRQVRCPTLLIHAEGDTTVPVADALRIYDNRPGPHVQLMIVPGDHERFEDVERGIEALLAFLQDDAGKPPSPSPRSAGHREFPDRQGR